MTHDLKTLPRYFTAVMIGVKTFEVRKDDRDCKFQIGDNLNLMEYDHTGYTGRNMVRQVTYILGRNEEEKQFVPDGYVILGIK